MKEFVVKVNKNEAQVLIDLCEKNNYKEIVLNIDGNGWFFIDFKDNQYSLYSDGVYKSSLKIYNELDFYKDMDKIVESFKPEFKKGDWVVCTDTKPFMVSHNIGDVGVLGMVDDDIFRMNVNGLDQWVGNIRHATPEEIAKAKGEDIMIGEYKVHFTDDGVKVGCRNFSTEMIKAVKHIANFYKTTGIGITFHEDGHIEYYDNSGVVPCDYKTLKKIVKKLKNK